MNRTIDQYDFIGDIHGHADTLERLLQQLGYVRRSGLYSHPEGRQVVFVGDFIDRGPKIRETLHIVKDMCDSGNALAVMGNHEYNAICFHTPHTEKNGFFRNHNLKEIEQHLETLRQFKHFEKEWTDFVEWFKKLPLFLELQGIRIVHAYWNDNHIDWIKANYHGMTSEFLSLSTSEEHIAYQVVEETLKGVESKLPDGIAFFDKDGHERKNCRIKWWTPQISRTVYGDVFMECPDELKNLPIDKSEKYADYVGSVPVFFGHYWLNGQIRIENPNAICIDYSVAKGGKLVAARFEEENSQKGVVFALCK